MPELILRSEDQSRSVRIDVSPEVHGNLMSAQSNITFPATILRNEGPLGSEFENKVYIEQFYRNLKCETTGTSFGSARIIQFAFSGNLLDFGTPVIIGLP